MVNPDFQYEVTRTGGTVRVDLTKASNVSEADTEAIVAATEALLTDDEVMVVQLDGPVMEGNPLDGDAPNPLHVQHVGPGHWWHRFPAPDGSLRSQSLPNNEPRCFLVS